MTIHQPILFRTIVACLIWFQTGCNSTEYDVIISGGTIYDGEGKEPIISDIGIKGEFITAIGDLNKNKSTISIDAEGLVVCPGFIDLHTHLDPLIALPGAENHVRQGVTTALGGPDGGGLWPFSLYMDSLETLELGYNVAYLVGHNKIREDIMGLDNRPPSTQELELMKAHVSVAMENGAFGLSTGLKYLPGTFSEVGEVIELAKVASRFNGIYTSHLREEGLQLIAGVGEAIQIGYEADIPVVLTHHKVVGQPMWGNSTKTLAMVDSARNLGIDVMIDQYPYNASYTGISILIPGWALAGGQEQFEKRMSNGVEKSKIWNQTLFNIINDRGGNDLKRVRFAKVDWKPELEGKTLYDWALMEELEPTVETGTDLVLRAQLNGGASAIFYAMDDADVNRIMSHPQTMIASDGRLVKFGDAHPHPRWYGTFPRVLGRYVREKKLITLHEALLKMTSMPAKRLGLKDRGVIKQGNYADITLFDPLTVIDNATFEKPHQYPSGIEWVIVNGTVVIENGEFSSNRPGKVLRSKSYQGYQ